MLTALVARSRTSTQSFTITILTRMETSKTAKWIVTLLALRSPLWETMRISSAGVQTLTARIIHRVLFSRRCQTPTPLFATLLVPTTILMLVEETMAAISSITSMGTTTTTTTSSSSTRSTTTSTTTTSSTRTSTSTSAGPTNTLQHRAPRFRYSYRGCGAISNFGTVGTNYIYAIGNATQCQQSCSSF
ncbi:uncharacterized protein BDZ83DRAFT_795309, partial [Colletotrichum acutatum]